MKNTILAQNQLQELNKLFSRNSDIQLAYIFGSVASGNVREDSDVDLAVFVDQDSKLDSFTLLRGSGIAQIVFNIHLSVVNLQESPLFLKQIIKGVCLYERKEVSRANIEAQVMNLYFDSQHFRDIKYFYLQKRIEEGTYGYR